MIERNPNADIRAARQLKINVPHRFKLDGLHPGDRFWGCAKCWKQLVVGSLHPPELRAFNCPDCGASMRLFRMDAEVKA